MTHRLSLVAFALALSSATAWAADSGPPAGSWSVEGELTAVSDYRFRGQSLSDRRPALQGGVTISRTGGAYGSAWASTLDEYGGGDEGHGATAEVDLVLGWAGAVAGLDVDVSAQAYLYPGAEGVNYVELPFTVSRTVEAWTWSLGAAYAPAQSALGDEDNVYGWGGLAWTDERSRLTFDLRAGYEDGAYAPGGKWDWSAGLSRPYGPLNLGLAYVDSGGGSAGLVASLSATF